MSRYVYYQSYDFPNYLVREHDSLFEEYKIGVDWVENRERIDIISGIDPFYARITEAVAKRIIRVIEK